MDKNQLYFHELAMNSLKINFSKQFHSQQHEKNKKHRSKFNKRRPGLCTENYKTW